MSFNVKDVVDALLEDAFADGDLISHEWLRSNLGITKSLINADPFILLSRVEELKSVLLKDHGIALQNVRGQGYRIVPPAEQAEYAAKEASRYIQKGLLRAKDLLENTRTAALDSAERKRHTDTSLRMAALSNLVSRRKRDVFSLFSPARGSSNEH